MARAVNFNGANYLINTSMGMQQFPNPYSCGNVSYWFKADVSTDGVIIVGFGLTLSEHQIRIAHNFSNNIMIPCIGLQNGSTNSNILGSILSGVPYDGQWHNIIWAWNVNSNGSSPWIINATLDGTPVAVDIRPLGSSSTSGFSIDYSWTDQWVVGAEAEVGSNYVGCLAELFLYVSNNDYSDITGARTPSLVFLLLPAGQRVVINLGPQGTAPFNDTPQIYLHGDHTTFPNNHGGATSFTQVPGGSLTDCGDDPFPPRAAYFDGNAYLRNDGTLVGLPASSPYGFLSYWYKATTYGGYSQGIIYAADASSYYSLDVFHYAAGYILLVEFGKAIGGNGLGLQAEYGYLPADSNWHNIILAWDLSIPTVSCYLDNTQLNISIQNFNTGGFSIPYSGLDYTIGAIFPPTGSYFSGSLAELFFLVGTPIDINDPNVRAKFIDPDTLLAVDIAANGSTPFGQDLLPQIYLSGGSLLFPMNFPHYSFTQVSATDTTPSSAFYTPSDSDALQDAPTDPFSPPPTVASNAVAASLGQAPLGFFPLS